MVRRIPRRADRTGAGTLSVASLVYPPLVTVAIQ
jgi:hypothetical protein